MGWLEDSVEVWPRLALATARAAFGEHRPDAGGIPQHNLHKRARGKLRWTGSVRGPSNQELKLTPGSLQGASPGQPAGRGGGAWPPAPGQVQLNS